MIGDVSYLEVGAQDAQVSQDFFCRLFDWPFDPTERPGEGWCQAPSIKVGLHGNDPTPHILIFFQVADMRAAVAKVKMLGGVADQPAASEPGFGAFCLCSDPQGVRFGLHQVVD